jgi:hypothetical protein
MAMAITNISITNTATAAATVTINLAGVALLSNLPIPGNGSQFIDLQQIIYNAETITTSASTTAVNFHIAGCEV